MNLKKVNTIKGYEDVTDRYYVSDGSEDINKQCSIYFLDRNGNYIKRKGNIDNRNHFKCKDGSGKQDFIYRVAMFAFKEQDATNKTHVHHLNHNRNDNSLDNLVWIDAKEHALLHAHDEKTKKLRSESIRKRFTNDMRKRISEAQSVSIDQYDLDGKFIRTWNSFIEASKCLGIPHGNMVKSCLRHLDPQKYKYPLGRNSAGGFIWKYHNV